MNECCRMHDNSWVWLGQVLFWPPSVCVSVCLSVCVGKLWSRERWFDIGRSPLGLDVIGFGSGSMPLLTDNGNVAYFRSSLCFLVFRLYYFLAVVSFVVSVVDSNTASEIIVVTCYRPDALPVALPIVSQHWMDPELETQTPNEKKHR